jgi:hypothetical protein
MRQNGLREDHIAFRSFACPMGEIPSGLESIERIFRPLGWRRGVDPATGKEYRYDFPHMHVHAIHLEFPKDRPDLPKIFLSELIVDNLDPEDAEAIKADLADTKDPLTAQDRRLLDVLGQGGTITLDEAKGLAGRCFHALSRPWDPPHRRTILKTNQNSQYAPWTLLNGGMNHIAYLTHDLVATAEAHRSAGRELLPKIMGSKEVGLLQTSVRSPMFEFDVRGPADTQEGMPETPDQHEHGTGGGGMLTLAVREDDETLGTIRWTGPFAEIIERPRRQDGTRRENFLEENAAHIFAATKNKEAVVRG